MTVLQKMHLFISNLIEGQKRLL